MLLHEFFRDTALRLPNKTALVCGDVRLTYAELRDHVNALVTLLQSRDVKRGDRVALFLDNTPELVVAVYATLQVGAVFMPVNPLTKQDKVSYLLNDSRASALITDASLAHAWRDALTASQTVHTCIVTQLDFVGNDAVGVDERCLAFPAPRTSPVSVESAHARNNEIIDQDLASIIYTSGSTGEPKGVMLTHLNMVSACRSVSTYLGLRESDVVICVLPLAFDYGLYQLLMSVKVGATLVLEQSFAFPIKVLEVMTREQVTVLPGVPTIFSMLMHLNVLDQFPLPQLRMITNTAAALSEEHIRRLRALFPQATLFSMYGLTECKRVTFLPPEQLDIRPTSVGRGMPNEEVWLVDENGARLPNGSTGELVIRGSNVMRGYWEKPDETAERLRPGPIVGEMILYSGDIFRTDEEGWLYFVARKDDIIKTRGEKVSPREVENVLYSHDAVLEAAVIGVPDDVLGQAVKAFVVLKDGRTASERELIRYCASKIENFMTPKYIAFVASLPKTDTGKIKKTGLA